MKRKIEKYRTETGSLYVYSKEHRAYLFCSKLNGKTKKQAIKEYEEYEDYEDLNGSN